VAATPHIAARFLKVNANVVNVNNYPVLSEISFNPNWTERKNEIVYIGGIFPTRGVTELVDALQYADTKLNLAGNYSPASFRDELIALEGWKKVNEAGFVNRNGIDELLGRSRVGIVTLHPTKAYLDSLPIKMFEYMAAGIPVVASDFPYWRSIINKHKCGVLVDPLNPEAIAGAINDLLSNSEKARLMGERGRAAALSEYSWSTEADKLISLYKSL
jgi:glycosyltransferase involved in cell wall biosynthesis